MRLQILMVRFFGRFSKELSSLESVYGLFVSVLLMYLASVESLFVSGRGSIDIPVKLDVVNLSCQSSIPAKSEPYHLVHSKRSFVIYIILFCVIIKLS